MVIFSSFRTGYNIAVEPRNYYSAVYPKGELLTPGIIRSIERVEGVDKVIPCVFDNTNISAGIGSNYNTSVLSLETNTIPEMMELLGLTLTEGTLPSYTNQIVLHAQVAANKNLKVGDLIGRLLSKKETLPGCYKIVGIIDGPAVVSFAPIEYYINTYRLSYEYIYGGIILPEEGALDRMNERLDAILPSDYQIDTLTVQQAWQDDYTTKISVLMSTIDIFILLIVSSCIGFLCYIYFSQRRSEFGLLWALGFSRQQVINRAFAEVNGINLLGYVFGVIISLLVGVFLNYVYFKPIGDPLNLIDVKCFLGAACSPIFVTLFSLIPVWRMLKKLDPITIIDGTML
jgi:putative ABC transport system permease protein